MDGDQVKSCFPPGDEVGSLEPEPTFTLLRSQCDNNPDDYEYEATISYKVCNDNDKMFMPRPSENFIIYATRFKDINSEPHIQPPGWDEMLKDTPKPLSCREFIQKKTFKPCENRFRAMTIAFDGNLVDTPWPYYCRCYLKEYVKARVINDSDSFTQSPTTSLAPSSTPVSAPSSVPSSSPTFPIVGSPNSVIATIKSLSNDYPDMGGFVHVDTNPSGGRLIINYGIQHAPINCIDCKIGIFEGGNCYNLFNAFYNPDETWNPWLADQGAIYVTNMRGHAASIINVFNGRELRQHICKFVALYDSRQGNPNAHFRINAIACGVLVPLGEDESFCQ